MRSLIVLTMLVLIQITTSQVKATDQRTGFTAGITIVNDNSTHSNSRRYTCNAARVKIGIEGFENVQALNCSGNEYQFMSFTKGVKSLILINSGTGKILGSGPLN